jgi:hypothetical protein
VTTTAPVARDTAHVLRVLDLGFDGLDTMMRAVAALREARPAPLGLTVGTHLDLAERHIRCGVRDAIAMLGSRGVAGTWDELLATSSAPSGHRVSEPATTRDAPAVLIGVDGDHRRLVHAAERSAVPVLNAASNLHQPLLVLADLVTLHDFLGPLRGRHVVLVEPDLALRRSWAEVCVLAGMRCSVTTLTGRQALGIEFADAVAMADLFGGELRPVSRWDERVDDADVVVGSPEACRGRFGSNELPSDAIVLPGRIDAEDAAPGHAGDEAARAVLFHRSRNVVVTAAALIMTAVR